MTAPQQIGYYHIEGHLGSGRYCDVYQATDPVRKRTVALKVLKPDLLTGLKSVTNFLQQAMLAADLVHPHLAWTWEVGEAEGLAYIAERYVNGPSLVRVLGASGPLPWEQALELLKHTCQGLDFAHARGWIHGDIRPQNILLSPDLGAVITDFGLANALRQAGLLIREPAYLAPEIWQNQPFSPASDQYALARTWAEALRNQPLLGDLTQQTQTEENQPQQIKEQVRAGLSALPRPAAAALAPALAVQPRHRYPTVGELAAEAERLALQAAKEEVHAWRENEVRARREADENARQQAEEAARLEALEKARREIAEQIHPETGQQAEPQPEVAIPQMPSQPATPIGPAITVVDSASAVEIPRRRPDSRRKRSRSWLWRFWPVWVGLMVVAIALLGLWVDNTLAPGRLFPATSTPTPLPPTATASATPAPTRTSTATPTPTATATATATATPTATATMTATASLTPTSTSTITNTPPPTKTPKAGTPSQMKTATQGFNPAGSTP
ncbi:MAG: protein kinase [Anaerolineales bacterium]|nr:protein kinase [Anaerolineales bacterium]